MSNSDQRGCIDSTPVSPPPPRSLIDLVAGPDDAELSAREMAMLEAYLKQLVSFSQMQQEARAAGRSETVQVRNKLKLIRDFNRNLRAINPLATHPEPEESRSLETPTDLRGVGPTEEVGDKGELCVSTSILIRQRRFTSKPGVAKRTLGTVINRRPGTPTGLNKHVLNPVGVRSARVVTFPNVRYRDVGLWYATPLG